MTFFPPDDIRQIMHSEEENMSDQRPNPDRFHLKFDARITGPIETVPWQPKRKPPHWNHRNAVIAAIVAIVAILLMVILVLTLVTPYLHSPN